MGLEVNKEDMEELEVQSDNAMSHFRYILKQRRILLHKYFGSPRPTESQAESSGAKRQKREREETLEKQLPDVFMEGNSSSKQ